MKNSQLKVRFLFFATISLSIISCDKRPDTTGYKQELKDREVMRVTDGQLTQFAFKKGTIIADSIQNLEKIGASVNSFVDFFKSQYFIDIQLLNKIPIDTVSKIYQVYDAYLYNTQNGIACEDNLQKIAGGDTLLFSRAIITGKELKGLWLIKMPKKELIKRITLKDIKQAN
jgi:hypothetical protein